jgi:hypothetical protein
MTAMLNMNQIAYFSWKGKTFVQITSAIQRNKKIVNNTQMIFKPLPLKIYRREIANTNNICNVRTSLRIKDIENPGGYLVYPNDNNLGLKNVLDKQLIKNNNQENEMYCNSTTNCLNSQNNAVKRVRSSGMIKRKYDVTRNNDTYYTSSNQYLISRNKTFSQNQYNYIRKGDASLKPGTNLAIQNIYSPNGLNHCKSYSISSNLGNNVFSYRWVNNTTYQCTINDGIYDIVSLNNLFQSLMAANGHYYYNLSNLQKQFLLNMVYDVASDKIQLQCFSTNSVLSGYTPASTSWSTIGGTQYNGFYSGYTPVAFIISSSFTPVIGFTAGTYTASSNAVNASFLSNASFGVRPLYQQVYFKPNNPKFSQQGAVSSSSLITRLKYDNITSVASTYQTSFGSAMADSLAYGVPTVGYTIKDKVGYPTKCTPIISKYGSVCSSNTVRVKR